LVFFVILMVGGIFAFAVFAFSNVAGIGLGVSSLIVAAVVSSTLKVADQWDRAVVLRLGRFHILRGP
jgi:regulator of protease activity HflC (stomatin/prohibitin superfamily)